MVHPSGVLEAAPLTVAAHPPRAWPYSTVLVNGPPIRYLFCPASTAPTLWADYCTGATKAYRRYGVTAALRLPAARTTGEHPAFVVAIDADAEIVGGLRVNGPLTDPDQAACLGELAASPTAVRRMRRILQQTLSDGIVEIKGFWVRHDYPHRHAVAATLTGLTRHIVTHLGVRHALCTAADHAAQLWQDAGGKPLTCLPPVPYPTPAYTTRVYWWDACDPTPNDNDPATQSRLPHPTAHG